MTCGHTRRVTPFGHDRLQQPFRTLDEALMSLWWRRRSGTLRGRRFAYVGLSTSGILSCVSTAKVGLLLRAVLQFGSPIHLTGSQVPSLLTPLEDISRGRSLTLFYPS